MQIMPPFSTVPEYLSMPGAESAHELVRNSPTENFIFCTFAAAIGGQAIASISDTVPATQWGGTSAKTTVSLVKTDAADLPLVVERSSELITWPTNSSQNCRPWEDPRRSTLGCSCGRRDRWSDRFILPVPTNWIHTLSSLSTAPGGRRCPGRGRRRTVLMTICGPCPS